MGGARWRLLLLLLLSQLHTRPAHQACTGGGQISSLAPHPNSLIDHPTYPAPAAWLQGLRRLLVDRGLSREAPRELPAFMSYVQATKV